MRGSKAQSQSEKHCPLISGNIQKQPISMRNGHSKCNPFIRVTIVILLIFPQAAVTHL